MDRADDSFGTRIYQFIVATVFVASLLLLTPEPASAATFTVTNTNDSGAGSFRRAIEDANNTPGADTINFDIPGAGPHTISPTSRMPLITDPVTINGYSQPGSKPNSSATGNDAVLKVELDGSKAGSSDGLWILAANSTVKGITINRFDRNGVLICCDSMTSIPLTGVRIEGNFIGTDPSGTLDRGNRVAGVSVQAGRHTVGGTTPAARNVISGNSSEGVVIAPANATNNKIMGNYIGTDKSGTADLGNDLGGVSISDASNNTVGGTVSGARNVISGNGTIRPQLVGDAGITVVFPGATGNKVMGNYVGTDASGTQALGNSGDGVDIYAAPNNAVGGTVAGARNVISGNGFSGVSILSFGATGGATGNLVQGNYVGTDKTGTADLGNSRHGVAISFTASGNTIGGTTTGARNIISGNDQDGVAVDDEATGNRILSNSIFTSGGLGIDLNDDGVTPNDRDDVDNGPNSLQNFPWLEGAESSRKKGTTVRFAFYQVPQATFTIQFFASPAADPSGNGEGRSFLGSKSVTTTGDPGTGRGYVFNSKKRVPEGYLVTATATNNGTSNTSEFSEALTVR